MRPVAELLPEAAPDGIGIGKMLPRALFRAGGFATMSRGRSFHTMSGRMIWKVREFDGREVRVDDFGGAAGRGILIGVKPDRFTAAAVTLTGLASGCACDT